MADLRSRPLLRTTLGDVLRRIRLEQGRTLADVSAAARMSMQYLSEIERGRKEASSEILASICDALDVGLPEVLAEVGRDLAAAGVRQQATVLRLRTGPERLAQSAPFPSRSGDVVSLLAA